MNITGSFTSRVGDRLKSDGNVAVNFWDYSKLFQSEIIEAPKPFVISLSLTTTSDMQSYRFVNQTNIDASKSWTGEKNEKILQKV